MNPSSRSRSATGCELAAEVVRTFGEVRIGVTGDSMLPSLLPGDVLTIRRQPFDEWRPGQIAVFLRGSGMVAHRIVAREGPVIVTRGDNLWHPDMPVGEDEIVGPVVSVMRNGRMVDTRFTTARRIGAWFLKRSRLLNRAALGMARLRTGKAA